MDHDADLLRRFVVAFLAFDGMRLGRDLDLDGDISVIVAAPFDDRGWTDWRPVPAGLSSNALEEFYRHVPGPLPPLYERLIQSYRWTEVDAGRIRLLGSLPPALERLQAAVRRDSGLFEELSPAGFVQFGRGPDMDYDQVCFDLGHRRPDGDCRIVKFDHEEILCNDRLTEVAEVAPSFRALVESIVADAAAKRAAH
jgi:hypothetical protein